MHVGKDDQGQRIIIFPRYHQWRAVQRLLADARQHGSGQNYLIQHSAGSGKSNTIGWLAHRLAVLHRDDVAVFDKVVVVTDRIALDQQLGDTVYQLEHKAGLVEKARSGSTQLAAALNSPTARIVISTIQKFPFVIEKLGATTDRNYAVIIDEAHSSQGGEAAKALRQALGAIGKQIQAEDDGDDESDASPTEVQDLISASVQARGHQPNLSYFAFTATPTRRTLELFGSSSDGAGPTRAAFDVYSMRQAIEEGFILDVLKRFMPYSVLWKIAAKANADDLVDKSKATQAIVRYVSRHPKTLDQKAHIIVEHFSGASRQRIGGAARAMVVCASRELAVRTYFAIKAVIAGHGLNDIGVLVAFSDSVRVDGEDYTEAGLNGFRSSELPKKFGGGPLRGVG